MKARRLAVEAPMKLARRRLASGSTDLGRAAVDAMVLGLEFGGVAICVCDENDVIVFVNDAYRSAFLMEDCGVSSDFVHSMVGAMKAGKGIRLQSTTLDVFESRVRQRRREQKGAISFAGDTVDGKWWWVTDSKLPNGWLVCVAQNISSLKQEEFKLRAAHASAIEEALTDCLTGIPNRRHGMQSGEVLLEACRSTGRTMVVALIDIDHFKSINDTYGHDVGDRVLIAFANDVVGRIRGRDQFSRIGGEEFLLVSADTDIEGAFRWLTTIMASLTPVDFDGTGPLSYTISIGVATLSPTDRWLRLLQRADVALYRAKASGRNRIEVAQEIDHV